MYNMLSEQFTSNKCTSLKVIKKVNTPMQTTKIKKYC